MKAANLGNPPGFATKRFTASLKEAFGPTFEMSLLWRSPKKGWEEKK
jgi:hypothetical protein